MPRASTVTAVSGQAQGVFVSATFEPESVPPTSLGNLAPLVNAARAGDAAATQQALTDLGVTVGDVDTAQLETFTVGPTPTVTLPPTGGGPFTDSVPDVELVSNDVDPISGPVEVTTQGALGADGFATSHASVADFNEVLETIELIFAATSVDVDCRSDLPGGPVGSTAILGSESIDGPLPENPAPNTVFIDQVDEVAVPDAVVRITSRLNLNEQTVGANDITVVGARAFFRVEIDPLTAPVELITEIEATVGEVSCGVVPGAVVEPTFTG